MILYIIYSYTDQGSAWCCKLWCDYDRMDYVFSVLFQKKQMTIIKWQVILEPQKLSIPPTGNQIDREPEVVIKATHWISDGLREKITSKTKKVV
jgi:hypothetical protein